MGGVVVGGVQECDGGRVLVGEVVVGEGGQGVVGAEFDERGHTLVVQGSGGVGVVDEVACVACPVPGGEGIAGSAGDQGGVGLVEGEACGEGVEFVEDGVGVGGVEGAGAGMRLGGDALGTAGGGDLFDGFRVAADHEGAGAVDRCDGDLVLVAVQEGCHLVLVVCTVAMAPSGMLCMRRARVAMKRAASGRVRMPARWAAVTSPRECPATKCGVMP